MTDAELKAWGESFIADRKKYYLVVGHTPDEVAAYNASWDYVDPIRIAVYAHAKSQDGVWAIDMPHIRSICVNTAAFIQAPPAASARAEDFASAELPATGPLLTDDGRLADCVLPPETL